MLLRYGALGLWLFAVAISGTYGAESPGELGHENTAPCAICSGLRVLPAETFTPFVMVADGKPFEVPEPWRVCLKCKVGAAEGDRSGEDLRAKLKRAEEAKAQWEERSGVELTLVATPYVALYTQARPQEIRSYALMTEKLAGHLQKLTGSMVLTRTRCDRDAILLLSEPAACVRFTEAMAKLKPDEGWENCRTTSGGVDRHIAFSNLTKSGVTADHHVVFLFGRMLMHEATDDKAPPWLREGFAAYAERAVFNQNLYASFVYKDNQPHIEPHWPRAIRTALQKGEKLSLGSVLSLDMASAGSTDYLCCYSVVSYLLEVHPDAFLRFVLLLRDGETPRKALEKGYAKSADELDAEWRKWAMNLGKL